MKTLLFSVTKKDLDIDFFNGTGKGGQNRNRNKNCCRIRHKDSGVIVTAQEERSQKANLKNAFKRLTEHPKFKIWLTKKTYELSEKRKKDLLEIEKKVEDSMQEKNLKIEYL